MAGLAFGAPVGIEVGTDLQALREVSDVRGRATVAVGLRASPLFAIESSVWTAWGGGFNGSRGTPTYLPQTGSLLGTRARKGGTLLFVFTPVRGDVGGRPMGVDVAFGSSLVQTVDDLALMSRLGDPVAESSEQQWHPGLSWALGPRVALSDRVSVRFRASGDHWVETYQGVNLTRESRVAAGMGLRFTI